MNPTYNLSFIYGYPLWVVLTAILIAAVLLVFNRYWAFLFCSFGLLAPNYKYYVFTRLPFCGPIINFFDVFIVFGTIAALMEPNPKWKKKHAVLILILLVIFISFSLGMIQFGNTSNGVYLIFRNAKYALCLPLVWFIAAKFLNSRQRFVHFLILLFLANAFQSFRHIFFVYDSVTNEEQTRTITYMQAGMFTIPFVLFMFSEGKSKLWLVLFGLSFVLNVVSAVYMETRSFFIGQLGAGLLVCLFFFRFLNKKRFFIALLVSVLAIPLLFIPGKINPSMDVFAKLQGRSLTLTGKADAKNSFESRRNAFHAEMNIWKHSTIIFGDGFGYQAPYFGAQDRVKDIAWGHIGYITYLAIGGIFGFLVYGIVYPFAFLFECVKLSKRFPQNEFRLFMLISFVIGVYCFVQPVMTGGLTFGIGFLLLGFMSGGLFNLKGMYDAYLQQIGFQRKSTQPQTAAAAATRV